MVELPRHGKERAEKYSKPRRQLGITLKYLLDKAFEAADSGKIWVYRCSANDSDSNHDKKVL
jgi:hypothetical protein